MYCHDSFLQSGSTNFLGSSLDGFLNLLPEFWRFPTTLLICDSLMICRSEHSSGDAYFHDSPWSSGISKYMQPFEIWNFFVTECSSHVLNLKQLLTFATFTQMPSIMVGDEKQKIILQIFSLLPLLIHRKIASGISTALSKGSEALGPQCKILLMALSHWDHHRVWTTDCIADQNQIQNQIFNGPVRLLAMATKPNLAFSYSVTYLADNMQTVQSVELKLYVPSLRNLKPLYTWILLGPIVSRLK